MPLNIVCACLDTTLNNGCADLGTALNNGCAGLGTALAEYWVCMPGHDPEYWVCRPIQNDIKKTCETLPVILRRKHKLQVFKHKELKQIDCFNLERMKRTVL